MYELPPGERLLFQNPLGAITDQRVILRGGRGQQDVPLRSIASVTYTAIHHPVIAALFVLLGIAALTRGGAGIVVGVVLFALAASIVMGSKKIRIAIMDGNAIDLAPPRGRSKAAAPFADALRSAIVRHPS